MLFRSKHTLVVKLQSALGCGPNGKPKKARAGGNNDDDDIIVEDEVDKDGRKAVTCTTTKMVYTVPMRNTLCGHVVDKPTIAQMIKARRNYSCPIAGCAKAGKHANVPCRWEEWVEDEDTKLKLESWKRRESRRKAREEEQDEDDESDDDDESEGEDVEVL